MAPVVNQGISNPPGGASQVSGNVQPVGIFRSGPGCADMEMDITGLRMIDNALNERMAALLRSHHCARVNARVDFREVINVSADFFFHIF